MNWFFPENVASTSDHAKELLEQGQEAPFAVIASEQSGGRGRTGRKWSSPAGNLYLTVVIPGASLAKEQANLIPLWVASVAAQEVMAKFKLRLTMKWPNDLLFAGKKLAGILCETQASGTEFGPYIIGIGMNCNVAPDVADQETTCLAELLPSALTPSGIIDLGKALAAALLQKVSHLGDPEQRALFAMEPGHPWLRGDELMLQKEIKSTGELVLESPNKDFQVEINHTHHDFRWAYQLQSPVWVADIGNTWAKIAITENPLSPPDFWYIDLQRGITDQARTEILSRRPKVTWPIHIGGVNQKNRDRFLGLIADLGFIDSTIPKRPLRVDFSSYNFSQMGIDRVALVEGMAARPEAHHKIGVSCGTALTIEVLRSDQTYLGGWILPGLTTGIQALHHATDQLPLLDPCGAITGLGLGSDTASAMSQGIMMSAKLMLDQLKAELEKQYPGNWEIFVSGGEGAELARLLSTSYHETLILEGFTHMVRGG